MIISDYYTYTEANPILASITLSTQFSDSEAEKEEIRYGFRSFSTQKMMNNFPQWLEMRENHLSLGQKMMHSWGHHLDDTIALYDEYRSDQFLSTADTYRDINIGISELSFGDENVYEPRFLNLLYNSSFSMLGATRLQKPEGWNVSRDNIDALKFNKEESLYGNHAIELDNREGDAECFMKQERELNMSGGALNLSIFVKTLDSSEALGERYNPDESGIVLVLYYKDNSTQSFGLGFPKNTEGEWARASFSTSISNPIFKFEVFITNRSTTRYIIDLPLLEEGSSPSQWSNSVFDTAPYLSISSRSITGAQVLLGKDQNDVILKRELFETSSEEEFKDVIIPTRLEQLSTLDDPLNSFNLEFGKEVTYNEEILATKWDVSSSGKIVQKAILTPDQFGEELLPADLYVDESGRIVLDKSAIMNEDITIEAVTVYSNWLLAASKETYLGTTKRVLKFIVPHKLTYEDTVLQSMGDIEIPITLSAEPMLDIEETTISRIGICKNLPFCIFIDISNGKRFYFEMKYDYFYSDLRKRKVFCRENYTETNSKLQVI